MENRRILLIALICVILFQLYQNWQADYGKPPPPAAQNGAQNTAQGTVQAEAVAAGATGVSSGVPVTQAQVRVQTDRFVAQIALAGGELRHLELSDFAVDKQHPQDKLALLDEGDGQQSLLSGVSTKDKVLTGNQQSFTAPQSDYALAEGSDSLDVPLEYTSPDGYTVRKVYHFKRGSYEIGLTQTLVNHSGHELSVGDYARLQGSPPPPPAGPSFIRSSAGFAGLGVYEQKEGGGYRFKKVSFKDLEKHPYESHQTGGWLAMLQHYFVVAVIVPQDLSASFSGKHIADSQLYQGQYVGALAPVADGASHDYALRFYVGPASHSSLMAVGDRFELIEDYGLLAPIAKPLLWVLKAYHGMTGNWGWAIVLLTCTVRLLFFPLSAAQYRSMAKMRKFQPRIQTLRERYADDRERLNKEMMELYRKEGFNPLAGCWPMLVQMPVFIALYWVLNQSVELRQAPFIFWMQDLSAKDPIYIMPVLYGISMWVQQRLSGQAATMDPAQARVMNVMPIALTVLFLTFPVGLVLYWFVSNMINIGQQQIIARQLEKAGLGKPKS
jgi:YidC/Oxa1 family membrane protein insertase